MHECDAIGLGIKGLVLSWENFEGERLLVTVLDLSSPVAAYSLEAFHGGRLVARQERLWWHEVRGFVAGLVRVHGDTPNVAFWDAAVQKLKAGRGNSMTRA